VPVDRRKVRHQSIALPDRHLVRMIDLASVVDGVIIVREKAPEHLADRAFLIVQFDCVWRHPPGSNFPAPRLRKAAAVGIDPGQARGLGRAQVN
jgi:hypothetical protein